MSPKFSSHLSHSLALLAALAILSAGWGVVTLCDEIPQVSQWKALCERCLFAVPLLAVLVCVRPSLFPLSVAHGVIIIGAAEAVLAIAQIYGLTPSGNGLFRLSGTFYNPGPLGGFLAVCLPPCLHEALCPSSRFSRVPSLAILAVILSVLPATMSRTAWLASLVSITYVGLVSPWGQSVLSRLRALPSRARLVGALVAFLVALGGAALLVALKRDSALGRLFLWRISARAIARSPWTGHSSFGAAYADAQEDYFSSGGESWEIHVADCPQYAFCDFLDVAIRHGLPVAILLLAVVLLAIVHGHRLGRHSLVGSLVALVVFSCGSYPLHVTAFVAIGSLLVLGCLMPTGPLRFAVLPLAAASIVACGFSLPVLRLRQSAMLLWQQAKVYYDFRAYPDAISRYSAIHADLAWNPLFLNEYGFALHKADRHHEALDVLRHVTSLSSDAMTLNTMGKCHQALGQYPEAEALFLRSARRLPNRLYPHHLLFLLYADSVWHNPAKRIHEAHTILSMPVKVSSPATDEIRQQAHDYLASLQSQPSTL